MTSRNRRRVFRACWATSSGRLAVCSRVIIRRGSTMSSEVSGRVSSVTSRSIVAANTVTSKSVMGAAILMLSSESACITSSEKCF